MERGQPDGTSRDEIVLVGSNLDFYPRGKVLFDDDFTDGLQGWTWLMDNVTPIPGPVWSSRRTFRGTGSMLLETGDVLRMDAGGFGTATAIKRLTLPLNEDGSYIPLVESEYWFGYSANDMNNPSDVQFGIDTQRPTVTGYRSYFKLRFHVYEQNTDTRTIKWQISTPGGFVDVPGMPAVSYFNESKGGFFHVRFRVNIATGFYDTIWINGRKFDISMYECTHDGYVNNGGGTFDYGLNYSVDLWNRLNTTAGVKKNARLYIPYARGSVV